MVFDSLDNIEKYISLNTRFEKAVAFLREPDLMHLSVGKYTIDDDNVYAIVVKEQGRTKDKALLETHEKYIDIQLVLGGIDEMGWRDKSSCQNISMRYDEEKDVQLYRDEPELWLKTTAGKFAMFFPEDAHMPMVSENTLHKIIVKVRVE